MNLLLRKITYHLVATNEEWNYPLIFCVGLAYTSRPDIITTCMTSSMHKSNFVMRRKRYVDALSLRYSKDPSRPTMGMGLGTEELACMCVMMACQRHLAISIFVITQRFVS